MNILSSLYSALRLVCAALLIAVIAPAVAAEVPQEILAPAWFKPTFLDFRDEVKEAAAAKKHLNFVAH